MTTPASSPAGEERLRHALHERHVRALLADAQFIRDYSDSDEREREAARYGREAMIEHGLGRITLAERDAILEVLSFVVITYRIGPGPDDDLPSLAIDELPPDHLPPLPSDSETPVLDDASRPPLNAPLSDLSCDC